MVMHRRWLALASLFALAACGAPPPPPAVIDLAITGGADQNPGPTGGPTAVQVFLYQLASSGKFETADVFALTERAAPTLGTDLLASETLVVAPGETKTITKEAKTGTTALGVVVFFRDIDHAKWRAVAPVAKNGPSAMNLTIKGLVATLAPR
jgi:type VI secretion system protein VasD